MPTSRNKAPGPDAREDDVNRDNDMSIVPATVSSPALLVRGSDAQFRELINGLLTLTVRIEMLRDHLAGRLGVTGPHYSMLMTVGQLGGDEGISVSKVARAMRVTSAFVATESNRLAKAGLLEKRPDGMDRRSVLLHLSPLAVGRLARLGAEIRGVNDQVFGQLARPEFDMLTQLVNGLVKNAGITLHRLAAPSGHEEDATTPDL
jgi:DNA-binding MarR family transcriptional regulator